MYSLPPPLPLTNAYCCFGIAIEIVAVIDLRLQAEI